MNESHAHARWVISTLETYRSISILVPPRIISHSPQNMRMTVREGRTARFSCRATGHPVPSIIWHVNALSRPGVLSTGMYDAATAVSRNISIFLVDGKNESILILRNISRFHSGRVDCSASNTLSTVNRQFLLSVKCKLSFARTSCVHVSASI